MEPTEMIELSAPAVVVDAAPALVFQVVAAAGDVVERRSENELVVDFRTRSRGRVIRTRELVRLTPSTRIDYEWIEGPLPAVRESIWIEPLAEGRSRMRYEGRFRPHPGRIGRLAGHLVVKPRFDRAVTVHLQTARRVAEERARRSKLFPRPPKEANR